MTLTEYLDQKVPARMPRVYLKPGEYIKRGNIKVGVDTLTFYEIPALWEKYGIDNTYVSVNFGKNLYTTDASGNKRSLSCFYLD
jgi:hypothetical protein